MTVILVVEASPRLSNSLSREAASLVVSRLQSQMPGGSTVLYRDLVRDPPPLVGETFADAVLVRNGSYSPEQLRAFAQSEDLIKEIEGADNLVISTPMHNFAIPAVLKAWVDQILRIGRSFHRTPEGKRGLLSDRPTFVLVATGGLVTGVAANQPDHLTSYLKVVLATLGIHDVTFAYLEGLAAGPVAVQRARREFRCWVDQNLPCVR